MTIWTPNFYFRRLSSISNMEMLHNGNLGLGRAYFYIKPYFFAIGWSCPLFMIRPSCNISKKVLHYTTVL